MSKRKYSQTFKNKLKKRLEQYIEENEYPTILQFCVDNDFPRSTIYGFSELSDIIEKAKTKSEAYLQDKMLHDKGNPMKYMFLLNALHGYRESEDKNKSTQQINTINFIGDSAAAQDYLAKIKREIKSNNMSNRQNLKSPRRKTT